MKLLFVGSFFFLLLSSFGVTNPIEMRIDGDPKCFISKKEYTFRFVLSGKLHDNESIVLTGKGISLSLKGKGPVYKGIVSTSQKEVSLRAFIYKKTTKTSDLIMTRVIKVCK